MIYTISLVVGLLLLFCSENGARSFRLGQLCSSNCENKLRVCDRQGCGHYGASRGTRIHRGSDIICRPGSLVMAPFPGKILRRSFPYSNNNAAYNNGLYIEGTGAAKGYRVKIFYFTPSLTSGTIKEGSMLGVSQALPHDGITQHLHLQLYKNGVLVNPELWF